MLILVLALLNGDISVSDPLLVEVLLFLKIRYFIQIPLYLIGRILVTADHKLLILLHLANLSAEVQHLLIEVLNC